MQGKRFEDIEYKKLMALSFNSSDTLFSHSTCPDEINYNDHSEDITMSKKRWCGILSLGGLAGLPFKGMEGSLGILSITVLLSCN